METFGFFEAIAHQNTRKSRKATTQPKTAQHSSQVSPPSQDAPQASPTPKSQPEAMTDTDPVFACWGMF